MPIFREMFPRSSTFPLPPNTNTTVLLLLLFYLSRGLDALHETEENKEPGKGQSENDLERDATKIRHVGGVLETQHELTESKNNKINK